MVLNRAQGLKKKSHEVSARKNNNRLRYNKKCRGGADSAPPALLGLSTISTVFAIDPLTEQAKDENKKAPDMKTTFSKKKEKKGGVIAKPEGQKRLPFSAAHLRNHLSTN